VKDRLKEYIIPFSITSILLTVSFILHFKSCGSPMTSSLEFWQDRMDLHRSLYPFSIRYLTTYSTIIISKLTSFPNRESFYVLQYGLAIIIGPVFYKFLRNLNFSRTWSNVGLFILLTSYPVLAAHFEPVHTWDDFWAYLFLILTFSTIIKNRVGLSFIFYTLACFSRDQTLIFFPIYVLAMFIFSKDKRQITKLIYSILPLAIFGLFLAIVWETPAAKRFELIKFNFENGLRTRDTVFSFYISFGFLWLTVLMTAIRLIHKEKNNITNFIFWGAVVTLPINTIVTLFFTTARETRIFFPPFIFVIPLSLFLLEPMHIYIRRYLSQFKRIILLIFFHGLMLGGVYLARLIFPFFEYRQCSNYCQEWAGINFGIMATLTFIYSISPQMRTVFEDKIISYNKK